MIHFFKSWFGSDFLVNVSNESPIYNSKIGFSFCCFVLFETLLKKSQDTVLWLINSAWLLGQGHVPLAQWLVYMTCNPGAWGSNPAWALCFLPYAFVECLEGVRKYAEPQGSKKNQATFAICSKHQREIQILFLEQHPRLAVIGTCTSSAELTLSTNYVSCVPVFINYEPWVTVMFRNVTRCRGGLQTPDSEVY